MPDETELEVNPESHENLSFHLGALKADHEQMRREWELHKAEMQSLRELVTELQSALVEVEQTAEEIAAEHPEEASLDAEEDHPALANSSEHERKPHWLARMATGV